jgi:hypothetical protein
MARGTAHLDAPFGRREEPTAGRRELHRVNDPSMDATTLAVSDPRARIEALEVGVTHRNRATAT